MHPVVLDSGCTHSITGDSSIVVANTLHSISPISCLLADFSSCSITQACTIRLPVETSRGRVLVVELSSYFVPASRSTLISPIDLHEATGWHEGTLLHHPGPITLDALRRAHAALSGTWSHMLSLSPGGASSDPSPALFAFCDSARPLPLQHSSVPPSALTLTRLAWHLPVPLLGDGGDDSGSHLHSLFAAQEMSDIVSEIPNNAQDAFNTLNWRTAM